MKPNVFISLIVIFCTTAFQASAEENKFSVGVGTYGMTLDVKNNTVSQSVLFYGSSLLLGYNFTDTMSVNSHIYNIDEQLFSANNAIAADYTNEGFDASLRYGPHDKGLIYFGALGFFKESIQATISNPLALLRSTEAKGLILGAGIGYNWESAGIAIEGYWRSTSDYESNFITSASAVTSSINASYRF